MADEDRHPLDSLRDDIRLARAFDSEIVDLQRRACEPSRIGGGNKTQSTLNALKSDAEETLAVVRSLADGGKKRNRDSREMMTQMEERMKQMKQTLIQLDARSGDEPAKVPRVFKELFEKRSAQQSPQ